jgi:glycosyltransferase involved in cell wall biosynthesis
MNKINIKLKGHIYENGGYAKVNRNLVKGLTSLGINVGVIPLGKDLGKYPKIHEDKFIAIDSLIPSIGNGSFGKYRILYTTVESYTLQKNFIDCCNGYNEIWTTSDFCKKIMKSQGIERPIFVFPNTISSEYNEDVDFYEFNPALNSFVFLSVFNWSYRKGYDLLLKAYLSEFKKNEDVTLLLVSKINGKPSDIIKNCINKMIKPDSPHIRRIEKDIDEKTMPSIYKSCSAFVLFSRGEGFGNIYCEASLCGLPVIATNHSGHSMFLNNDNSTLIEVDELRDVNSNDFNASYWEGTQMPNLSSSEAIEAARRAMRGVYEQYTVAVEKNELLKEQISDKFSISKVSNDIKSRLEFIWKNI